MKTTDIVRSDYYDRSIITSMDDLINSVKRIESLFRNSREYRNYICSVREGLQKKQCAYFTDKDFSEATLELHHVFSLYDITMLVGLKQLSELENDQFLTVYDVVNELIDFHMKDFPITIMLSKTVHELYHSGQYELPKDSKELHLGNYTGFIREYKEYMDKEEVEKLTKLYKYFNVDITELINEGEIENYD